MQKPEKISQIISKVEIYEPTTKEQFTALDDKNLFNYKLGESALIGCFTFFFVSLNILGLVFIYYIDEKSIPLKYSLIGLFISIMITVIFYVLNKKSNQKTNAFYAENNFTHPPTKKLTVDELFEEIDSDSYMEVQYFAQQNPILKSKIKKILAVNSYITKNDYLQLYLNDLVELHADELKAYKNEQYHIQIEKLKS